REHGAEAERAVAERSLRHAHHHAADEALVAAARAALLVIDAVDERVAHHHPIAIGRVDTLMRRAVGQPARARTFTGHRIGAEESFRAAVGMRLRSVIAVIARRRGRGTGRVPMRRGTLRRARLLLSAAGPVIAVIAGG